MRVRSFRQKVTFGLVLIAALVGGSFVLPQHASAAYVEHNLIEDQKFLDAASMNQQQIQSFLEARGSYLAKYNPWSGRDNGNVPASRVIYEAAQDYGISPKVLLATMQKEQSLVTAKNPTQTQLDRAMGYGCPDSSACQEKYYGFYNQVDNASWQFRYNFERARGNNTWWRVSSSYACGSATRYYSTGLYVGRYVTFYDDAGRAYKSFTINNASTASLYCYTPHAYSTTSSPPYSGSYNFVTMYEAWFGSTQPDVIITTPLRMSTLREGAYTGQKITFSFDIQNTAPWPMGIGTMMIAVRDSQNRNYDFGPQQMVLEPKSTVTYTASVVLDSEETYTFSIANNYNGWNDSYPSSVSIDNPRKITTFVQAMPTITAGPAIGGAEQRVGKSAPVSFQVKNNSAQPLNLGKIGLAMRDEQGNNRDVAYESVPSLAPGATYSYAKTFMPQTTGRHKASISVTKDNGVTWDDGRYPATASAVSREMTFDVKQNPSITTGISLSNATPHVDQPTTVSFQVTNYGDAPISLGKIGLAVRDPQGANRDPRWDDVTVGAGQTHTYTVAVPFNKAGTWHLEIGNYNASLGWNAVYPTSETNSVVRKLSVNVLPSVTVTDGITVSDAELRSGKATTASFTLKNFSSNPITLDTIGLAARGPNGENLDLGWDRNITILAGQSYVYSKQASFGVAGQVRLSIGSYSPSTGWTDAVPASETPAVKRVVSVNVLPSPTVVTGITLSDTTPQAGQTVLVSFQVTNYGDASVSLGKIGLAVRDPQGANRDPRWDDVTVLPGQTHTYSVNVVFDKTGTWNMELGNYNGSLGWNAVYPVSENGSVARKLGVQVAP